MKDFNAKLSSLIEKSTYINKTSVSWEANMASVALYGIAI